jgi:glycosyltransferase involved in cell wall biosynthesis
MIVVEQATIKPGLLVLASTYPRWPGDPEPGFVHELAKRLTHDFEVGVVCPHAAGAKQKEIFEGVKVVRFRYAPEHLETLVNDGGMVGNLRRQPWKCLLLPVFAASMMIAIRKQISSRRPSAIHAHWLIPQGLLAVLAVIGLRSKPAILVTSHGADLFALRGAVFDYCRRYVIRRVRYVTVVSAVMKERLVATGVSESKIGIAPMGVDFQSRFTLDPATPRSLNELLFVGRLVEKKGLRFLLEALPAIIEACPSVKLTVAGFGPEEAALRELGDKLGVSQCIDFLGAVAQADLPALYRRAAVFVAPFVEAASGDQEGLGLVALEASGCGCPVVITDMPATRDVFAQRVRPGSPEDIAAAIIALLADSTDARSEFAARQRMNLTERYDWRQVASGYAGILRNTIGVSENS